jgi:hypothetical protein
VKIHTMGVIVIHDTIGDFDEFFQMVVTAKRQIG